MAGVEHERRRHLEILEVVTTTEVVAAADLVGSEADLGGKDVHRPLDRVARLGSAGATISIGRGEVGEVAVAGESKRRHVVHAGVEEAAQERHARGDQHHVGTHVGIDVHPTAHKLAVGVSGELDLLELAATLMG